MQNEITEKTDLLDSRGRIVNPGFARRMLFNYNRENIRANIFALKEWDFYQILQGDWVLQLTIGHVSYIASTSAWIFNLKTGEKHGFGAMKPFPLRSMPMPRNPEVPNTLSVEGKGYSASYEVTESGRRLRMSAKAVEVDITLNNNPANEKMVIATPFAGQPTRFYLNYKENFWGARGTAVFGEKTFTFDGNAAALIDWGRGVWPFTQEWFWGNCTARIGGQPFGFNIGWGFGDLSRATENMFFWNNKAYKLGVLTVSRDEKDYMQPWHFVSDGEHGAAFDVTMTPVYDNYSETKILFIDTHCHQVHGLWNGTATLPGGETLKLENICAFCEHAQNRW
jgi:hypothetical protein